MQAVMGRILSALAILFLLFDSAGKLFEVQPVIDGTLQLGYPRDAVFTRSPSATLLALLPAATGARLIAPDFLGRSVRLHRTVIELAGSGQRQLLSSAI